MTGEKLLVTFDMDGVFVPGPPAFGTLTKLVCGKPLTNPEIPMAGYYRSPSTASEWLAAEVKRFAIRRRIKNESIAAVQRLVRLGREFGRDIEIGILTGRTSDMNEITMQVLESSVCRPYLSLFLLNEQDFRSPLWKEMCASKLKGHPHFHFEDDLEPTLRMSAEGSYVYLLRNLSNRDCLLRYAGITLPSNVTPVANITAGLDDFESRLSRELI